MVNITQVIVNLIFMIILILVIFQLLADVAPDFATASGNITAQSAVYPLTNLLKARGLIYLILIVAVFITIMVGLFKGIKGGK